ncbi:YggT family protein [Candidatus Saccharibacteria bacterium]|nr:MAG: YggT family protein [Candidatus Saccharibacteria bacterium]
MAHVIRETRYVEREGEPFQSIDQPVNIAARVVSIVVGIINGLLAIRFILMLLGANTGNAFASLIYNLTRPLVAPFFGLFSYQPTYGSMRFEYETLVAIVVYSLLAWVAIRLLNLGSDRTEA